MASNRRTGGRDRKNGRPRVATSRTAPSNPRPTRTTAYEAKPTRTEISHQTIAEAAYFLWLREGGDDLGNWLKAERLLAQRSATR